MKKGKYIYSENVILFNQKSGYMFVSFPVLETIIFGDIDTSQVTNMEAMFGYSTNLKKLDLSDFDTSQLTRIDSMFFNCKSLKSLDLSKFDTSKINDMYGVFYNCSNLKELDVSNWDVSNVTNMVDMFAWSSSFYELKIGCDCKTSENNTGMFAGAKYNMEKLNKQIEETQATCSSN